MSRTTYVTFTPKGRALAQLLRQGKSWEEAERIVDNVFDESRRDQPAAAEAEPGIHVVAAAR